VFESSNTNWWEGGEDVPIGDSFKPQHLDTPLDQITRRRSGKRSRTRTDRKRGRYIQSRPAGGDTRDIAFDATIRAAAPYQKQRSDQRKKVAFAIQPGDLQRKVRISPISNLVLFVVDASWSMAVAERMSATKGAILSLLTDAYQRRDRVGLVVFQKDRASLVLPPTNSTQLARKALADIPVGGKTPLSAGLAMAHDVINKDRITHPESMPLMILLTDGVGNVSMSEASPQEEASLMAHKIAEEKIPAVIINMEAAEFDQGLAKKLAEDLRAKYFSLAELEADRLYHTVKGEIHSQK
jgi:magnesium chelatase subunit D